MKELILGGARSGKSSLAERLAAQSDRPVVVIATSEPEDDEMRARVAAHRARRPRHWRVIEESRYLARVLAEHCREDGCVVVDCLTLWLTNLLCRSAAGEFQVQKRELLSTLPRLPGRVIFVSNEVGLGIVPMGELSRRFCDESGWLHQDLAEICDRVAFMHAGLPLILKGPRYEP